MTDESSIPKDLEERFLANLARRDEWQKTTFNPNVDYDAWFEHAMVLNEIQRESLAIWKDLADRRPDDAETRYRYETLRRSEEMRLQIESSLMRIYRRPDTAEESYGIMTKTLESMLALRAEANGRNK